METPITFENMPNALAYLIQKVESLEKLVLEQNPVKTKEEDTWFNLDELRTYLSDRPDRQTVYGLIGRRAIPFHKKGKNSSSSRGRLMPGSSPTSTAPTRS